MRKLFIATWLSVLLLASTMLLVLAQSEVVFTQPDFQYTFADQITFTVTVQSETPIESALLFFQADKDAHTQVAEAKVEPLGDNKYRISHTHQLADYTLSAFADISYHFEVTLENGEVAQSPVYSFFYEDNRFPWQSQDEKPFEVHWYEGDVQFAQQILDSAQEGLGDIRKLIPLAVPDEVDIYVYPNSRILQSTLSASGREWIAGHASPDLGVMVVSLPASPDQSLLIAQRVPHELLHIMLYQSTGLGYENIPVWLKEGLASIVELYPNPDYDIVLDQAVKGENLLPMAALCQNFPQDASNALLAYAQSASFLRYLYGKYGSTGLENLITAYADGLDCERGARSALGNGLSQLERDWQRDTLAQNPTQKALNYLLPWLAIIIIVLAAPTLMVISRLSRKPTK